MACLGNYSQTTLSNNMKVRISPPQILNLNCNNFSRFLEFVKKLTDLCNQIWVVVKIMVPFWVPLIIGAVL